MPLFNNLKLYFLYYCAILQIPSISTGFLGSVRARVESGTSACFNVTTPGYLYVHLISEFGDCDLYASTTNETPDYNDYAIQSTTCGVDSVIIPKRYNRPVYIAMYGHPSHNVSKCSMSFCSIDVTTVNDEFADDMTELSILHENFKSSCEAPDTKTSYTPRALHFFTEILLEIMLEVLGST